MTRLASLVFLVLPFCAAGCAQGPLGITWGQPTASTSAGVALLSNANEPAALSLISQYCISCHTSTSGPLNVYNLTDVQNLVSTGLVSPGSASTSTLYNVVASGQMPPGNPLDPAEVATLNDWISNN